MRTTDRWGWKRRGAALLAMLTVAALSSPASAEDMDELDRAILQYRTANAACSDASGCEGVGEKLAMALRKRAARFTEQAHEARFDASRRELLRRAARDFDAAWQAHGDSVCDAGSPKCAQWRPVALAVGTAYEAAGYPSKARRAYLRLWRSVNPPMSAPERVEACFGMARTWFAIAEFSRAARELEDCAKTYPKHSSSPDALVKSAETRLALGDLKEAKEAIALFVRFYSRKRPATAASLAVTLSRAWLSRGDLEEARRALNATTMRSTASGDVGLKIRAHVQLARTHLRTRDTTAAHKWFAKTANDEKWRSALAQKASTTPPRNLRNVVDDMGEALFFAAADKREAALATKPPSLEPSMKADAFSKGPFDAWFRQRRSAIQEVEKAYRRIVSLEPHPPPEWSIRASLSVAQMWNQTHREIVRQKYPKQLLMLSAMESARRRADSAFRTCDAWGAQMQWAGPALNTCRAWLQKHDRTVTPIVELAPGLRRSTGARSSPLMDPRKPSGW